MRLTEEQMGYSGLKILLSLVMLKVTGNPPFQSAKEFSGVCVGVL